MKVDAEDKLRFLKDVRAVVRGLNEWADKKIETGAPLSDVESQALDQAREKLRELKKILNNLAD